MDTPAYAPAARRPIGELFRASAHDATGFCVRHGIHPDTLSVLSVVSSIVSGLLFWQAGRWPILLLLAPLFSFVRLWLNMLDGMVALAGGTASRRGEVFNELPDRLSDVIVFLGIAYSGLCHPLFGCLVANAALLVAYVGTLGQALGAGRQFGGPFSKPWRIVFTTGAVIATYLAIALAGSADLADLVPALTFVLPGTLLDVALVILFLGCGLTSMLRVRSIFRTLG